jgi:hypothetical protein
VTILIILFIVVILGIIFFNPKLGTFLIWPILFTYPHGWWFYHGFLPLNIGYDDLFCIALFLVVFVRRNMLGGVPLRLSFAFWVITSFIAIVTLSGLSGALDWPSYREVILKEILKVWIFWCLFYSILHCIDNEHDLRIQFTMFSLAAVLGAGLVIFQYFAPSLALPWQLPEASGVRLGGTAAGTLAEDVELRRAYGAFMNANGAACVLSCSFFLLLGAVKLQKTLFSRMLVYGFAIFLLIGILVTKSRSGFLMLGATLFLMGFLGRNKKLSWLALITLGIVLFLFPETRESFLRRVSDIYDPLSKEMGRNVLGRVEVWKRYFQTANFKIFLLGQGNVSGIIRNETESHSLYVSLFTVYGAGSLVWALSTLIGFLRRARYIHFSENVVLSQVATTCLWVLFAWGVYAATSDALSSNYPRYLLFYLVVLVDRAYHLALQDEIRLYENAELITNYSEPWY